MAKEIVWWSSTRGFGPLKVPGYSRRESGPGGPLIHPTDLIQISELFDREWKQPGERPMRTSLLVKFTTSVYTLLGKIPSSDPAAPTVPQSDIDCLCLAIKAVLAARADLAQSISAAKGNLDELHRRLSDVISEKLKSPNVFGQERDFDGTMPSRLVWIEDSLDGRECFRRPRTGVSACPPPGGSESSDGWFPCAAWSTTRLGTNCSPASPGAVPS